MAKNNNKQSKASGAKQKSREFESEFASETDTQNVNRKQKKNK